PGPGAPRPRPRRLEKPPHATGSRQGAPPVAPQAGETAACDGFSPGRPARGPAGWRNRRMRRVLAGAPRPRPCQLEKPPHATGSRGRPILSDPATRAHWRAVDLRARAERWAAEDPDPTTRAELTALLSSGDDAAL